MDLLGYLAWWHLADVRLTADELRQRLSAAGFPVAPSRTASTSRVIV